MDERRKLEQLAALLDGEIRDNEHAAELNALLAADPELKAEYETQREIKTLLGKLEQEQPPAHLSTRISGEIATRRKLRTAFRWRSWAAAGAGFCACLVLTVLYIQLYQPGPAAQSFDNAIMADRGADSPAIVRAELASTDDDPYRPQYWTEQPADWPLDELPVEQMDPELLEFLKFARDVHGYHVLLTRTDALTPDMPAAILVVEEGGTP